MDRFIILLGLAKLLYSNCRNLHLLVGMLQEKETCCISLVALKWREYMNLALPPLFPFSLFSHRVKVLRLPALFAHSLGPIWALSRFLELSVLSLHYLLPWQDETSCALSQISWNLCNCAFIRISRARTLPTIGWLVGYRVYSQHFAQGLAVEWMASVLELAHTSIQQVRVLRRFCRCLTIVLIPALTVLLHLLFFSFIFWC